MSSFLINPYRFGSGLDADAAAYIAAVEAADSASLEAGVKDAINAFVVGCKADNIWTSLNMCLILCGANTIDGALVPLLGPSPTKVNLTSSEYNRKTGLSGNSAASAYLNTNYSATSDPQNDYHCSVYATTKVAAVSHLDAGFGGSGSTTITSGSGATAWSTRSRSNLGVSGNTGAVPVFVGLSRSLSTEYQQRTGGTESTMTRTSAAGINRSYWLFAANTSATPANYNNSRTAFVSAGSSLDLGLLRARVDTLMAAIDSAIP